MDQIYGKSNNASLIKPYFHRGVLYGYVNKFDRSAEDLMHGVNIILK
jgi:hypothetical protein